MAFDIANPKVDDFAFVSYSAALILMVACIMVLTSTWQRRDNLGLRLINLFGTWPGFAGVLFGFSLMFTGRHAASLGVLYAWFLLEVGALQLTQLLKKIAPGSTSNEEDRAGSDRK